MWILDSITSAFINIFGITQPTDKARRRASWFICILLALTLVFVAIVGIIILRRLLHA